ncbi:Protein roadkill [Aphelenchoides bicaudatus]|nr:Protein roadkill [Aphelenchoides bicaudatus]
MPAFLHNVFNNDCLEMQRAWPPPIPANSSQAPQENAVTEGNDRSGSPFSYNIYEADPIESSVSSDSGTYTAADFWCVTQMNVLKFNYVWSVHNFSIFHDDFGELKSSTFGMDSKEKLRFCLRINPKGLDDESREYLSLYLLLVQSNKADIRAKFKFSILNADKEESRAMESQRFYRFIQGKDWGFKKFIRRDFLLDEANGLLTDDKLMIYCEVSIVADASNMTGKNCSTQLKPVANNKMLAEDFGSLFGDEQFSDFTIKVDNIELKTHKCILAARSPVFKAMFSHQGLAENATNCLEITDLNAQTIKGMLQFVYSGSVTDLNNVAFSLLAAADKYEIKQLKTLCEHALCTALSVPTVCEIYLHADMHTAEDLKNKCIWFINQNSAEVMQTEGYGLLSRELVNDLYKAVVVQNQRCTLPVQSGPSRKKTRFH